MSARERASWGAMGLIGRAAIAVWACVLSAPLLPGCASGAVDEVPLDRITQEGKVKNCQCAGGKCSSASYSDVPSDNTYYVTTFGGGVDTQPMMCAGKIADGTWAYIADSARFGCGAKVKVEANGKSCIAEVADCGPNRCVEDAASDPNTCASHFPIIDASPFITKYLVGMSGVGWSDKVKVKTTTVSSSATLGCPGSEGGSSSGSGGSSSGGSGGASGAECTKDSDCGGTNARCDKGLREPKCVTRKELGQPCSKDSECNGDVGGTQRICQNSVCTDACRTDFDCDAPDICEKNGGETGRCKVTNGCVLDYPKVSIVGIPTPASVRQSYASRGCGLAPSCMIDVNNIVDAKTRKKLSYKLVQLSDNFTLKELTWQSAGSSPYVYVDPEMVKSLQATRSAYGAIHVNSGYRSPVHQNKVCMGMCGKSSCQGTCARCSNHMGGQAVDVRHSSPKCALASKACNPGKFHYIYNELAGGDHLHIDTGPQHGVCSYQAISCGKAL